EVVTQVQRNDLDFLTCDLYDMRKVILWIALLRKILLLNDGRDKILKVVQYSAKFWLFLRALTVSSEKGDVSTKPIKNLISAFSLSRRVIRLGSSLGPFNALMRLYPFAPLHARTTLDFLRFYLEAVNSCIGIVNDTVDDLICLIKIGYSSPRYLSYYNSLSDRLWFSTILIDLFENSQALLELYDSRKDLVRRASKQKGKMSDVARRQVLIQSENNVEKIASIYEFSTEYDDRIEKMEHKVTMQQIGIIKLLADGVFCGFDVLRLGDRGWSDGWQTTSGLASALLSSYKLCIKEC
ncbi:hypothetical protein HK096_011546, partial [Nowakowskiella sp. JEL0078]